MNQIQQSKWCLSLCLTLSLFLSLVPSSSAANVDLQADLNRIVQGINKFDSNAARSAKASNLADIKSIFANNGLILNEIQASVSRFKQSLNDVKRYIPTKDTKETPKFSTLMNLALGYEEWLRYQKLNQSLAERCLKSAGKTFKSFSECSLRELPKTLSNERLGRAKLQSAWNAWKQWQIKFGYG
jgi:hypothetical protein